MRIQFFCLVTLIGLALCVSTEVLSILSYLRPLPLALFWLAALAIGIVCFRHSFTPLRPRLRRPDLIVVFCIVASAAILIATATAALLSPPNSSDAMAYHLPRIFYWVEQSSVRFFPTPYLNQVMLQPFAEYAMLHLYLLSGGDHGSNLVQWFASIVSILAVSLAARSFGANVRGQAIASLFCATVPAGVLAASGAKNDYVLGMWLIVTVCFAQRFVRTSGRADAFYLGAASGLALLTKGTAYLYLPFVLAAIFAAYWRPAAWQIRRTLPIILLPILLVNAPHFWRNYELSGSVLGFDSAHGDGFFRWRNETFGWRQTASNAARHVSEQIGARSERWNQGVYSAVLSLHSAIGIDPNDPAATWRWSKYQAPQNANHETSAPNRWHLFLLLALGAFLFAQALGKRQPGMALYAASIFLSFLALCFYLKWQPYMARLLLPLFVAGAPLAGILGEIRRGAFFAHGLICVFLLDIARLPATQNWVRPLKGPRNVFQVPREDQYFSDLTFWNNRESYVQSARAVIEAPCRIIGIDINNYAIEYPLLALVRAKKPEAAFLHTAVNNPSKRYPQPVQGEPCMVVCLDCAEDLKRLAAYRDFSQSKIFGRFVVFSK